MSVYRSKEGKEKILAQYRAHLDGNKQAFTEQILNTRFGKTFVLKAGKNENPAVILLHGSSSNAATWVGELQALQKSYYVIAVDILGEPNFSDETRLNLENDEVALWLDDVFKGLELTKASLVGNSFGGWLALKYACLRQKKITSLVLVASSGVLPPKLGFVFKAIVYTMQGKKEANRLMKLISGKDNVQKIVLDTMNTIMENFIPRTGSLAMIKDEELKALTIPICYIGGENDVTVDTVKSAQKLKSLAPQVTTKIIKNNGHIIYDIGNKIDAF